MVVSRQSFPRQSHLDEKGPKNPFISHLLCVSSLSRPQPTTDDVRLRCRELLTGALRGSEEDLPDGVVKPPEELAELVEDSIFKKYKNTDMKYKAHVRSRIFNLKVYFEKKKQERTFVQRPAE